MGAIDPVTYLRATPPFDELPGSLFDLVAGAIDVTYAPTGAQLGHAGGEPLQHLYVIRKGAVRLERDGQTIQVLEEGETFGYTSLITGKATLDVLVEEDLVVYRLPGAVFRRLLEDARFAGHFAAGLGARLRSSLEHGHVPATLQVDLSLQAHQLVRGPPLWVAAEATAGDAARAMRAEQVSSALVRTEPPGIVTDRDFRNRLLAARLGPATPVTRISSCPLRVISAETPIYEAWTTLLDTGFHHLPVERDGAIVGVITASDLLRASAQGPVAVLRRVERLPSRAHLPGYGQKVAEMAAVLLAGGLQATVIAGFVARLNDVLVRRLLGWAEADLGPPPAPYAWMVFGSEGRMEQTLLTDQDNAIVFDDEGVDRRDWYAALAERVNADLEAAGFAPCRGNHVARRWNGPLSEWTRRFEACLDEPRPHDGALFFDFRRVGGELSLAPLEEILARAPRAPLFLRFLAREAMEFSPPATLLLRLRGGASTVDLKRQGLSPVVFLARCYGLEVGASARGTVERLEAATRAGLMAEDVHATVSEAYRFLLGLRLRLQLRAIADGKAPVNHVPLSDLGAVERSRLKEAFRAIKRWQDKAAYHYQTDFL